MIGLIPESREDLAQSSRWAEIPLSQGFVVMVDGADYEWLRQWKWFCRKGRKTFYARRSDWSNGKVVAVHMHRLIMGAKSGQVVDHIDGNGLNNCRSNLRLCVDSDNRLNAGLRRDNTSGYKGVSFFAREFKWWAKIWVKKKFIHLGYFDNKHDAAEAYNAAAKIYHGEFARLNNVVR